MQRAGRHCDRCSCSAVPWASWPDARRPNRRARPNTPPSLRRKGEPWWAACYPQGLPTARVGRATAICWWGSSRSASDPPIPGLAPIAWKEIERQRESAGIPKLVLQAALALPSSDGRSYRERIDGATTELQLSEVFDDFIGRVPLAKGFLADRNPVRTGGPMQVSVAFARIHAATARPYPYPGAKSLRDEVFTRRGGLYFGIAHLLDYPAPYDSRIYRFADFNAGRYASRNAAFQMALSDASGIPLQFDGDLVRFEHGNAVAQPGNTELAARVVARRLEMSDSQVRHDLELGNRPEFERSRLYTRLYALADERGGRAVPRAALPRIELHSAKFTRKLTTEWFARRVSDRYRACLARAPKRPAGSAKEENLP